MASRKERRLKRQAKINKLREEVKKEAEKEEVIKKEKSKGFRNFYEEKYKTLLMIPFTILILAFVIIGVQFATTGDFVAKDVSLKGGLTVTVLTEENIIPDDLENSLTSSFSKADIKVRSISELGNQVGLIVDASDADQNELLSFLGSKIKNFENSHSVESVGPSLGASFFKQTMFSILIAFIFMSLVVFYYFRTFVPSFAVVLAAFSDMVVTIAIMNVLGLKLSTAGIAALLMLIGYSVDTDILLSTRVLKRKEGSANDRMIGAVKTGLTMNATTMAAISIALILSQSETLSQIMTILLIGLFIDIINTWLQNVGILRMYLKRKGLA